MALRVGFLSSHNYHSRTAFSGTMFSMYRALERRPELQMVDLGYPAPPTFRRRLQRKLISPPDPGFSASLWSNTRWRARIMRQLFLHRPRILFAPQASVELFIHRPGVPYVYSSDATYEVLSATYALDHTPRQAAEAAAAERHAIAHAARCHFPSNWAARSAIRAYGADPERVDVVPYGANLTEVPDPSRFDRPEIGALRLLFVGRDWVRKGGDTALGCLAELRARGVDAELTIVGCRPPGGSQLDGVRVIEYINKDVPAEAAELERLYLSAHFLLFPTRADCSPISLCEAAAFGLVAVASNAGGIADIVRDGETGYVLPLDAPASLYAERIAAAAQDRSQLQRTGAAARKHFEETLNWDAWSAKMVEVLRRAVASPALQQSAMPTVRDS